MKKKNVLRKRKGFTLIELIVVIAILGIIAVIVVPRFGTMQANARIKADIASANEIVNAAKVYIAQEDLTNAEAIVTDAVTVTVLANEQLLESATIPAQAVTGDMSLGVSEASNALVFTVTAGGETILPAPATGTYAP